MRFWAKDELYRYLHEVFDASYPPTSLHQLLARARPQLLRESGSPQLLILTTNYDDLLERALEEVGEPFDVVWYEAKRGPLHGRFVHRVPGGDVGGDRASERVHAAADLERAAGDPEAPRQRSTARTPSSDSYVITEDSYIDYLVGRRRRRG